MYLYFLSPFVSSYLQKLLIHFFKFKILGLLQNFTALEKFSLVHHAKQLNIVLKAIKLNVKKDAEAEQSKHINKPCHSSHIICLCYDGTEAFPLILHFIRYWRCWRPAHNGCLRCTQDGYENYTQPHNTLRNLHCQENTEGNNVSKFTDYSFIISQTHIYLLFMKLMCMWVTSIAVNNKTKLVKLKFERKMIGT